MFAAMLLSFQIFSEYTRKTYYHPGVGENIAPVGGPGSDITNEGLKL